MKKRLSVLIIALIMLLTGCSLGGNGGSKPNDSEPTPTPAPEKKELGIKLSSLEDTMKPIFSGNTVQDETVFFLDKGEEKTLLFDIDKIESVTSYDLKTTYKEGVDYALKDGKIVCLEGGSIPCITSEKYWSDKNKADLVTKNGDVEMNTFWGEGTTMTDWQVRVTYTHSDSWKGFYQPSAVDQYEKLIKKLQNKEDVTFFFYGDSITFGANASFMVGTEPKQHTYSMLFTEAIADLFGYKVKFISTGKLGNTCRVPKTYNEDNEPTITYVNTSVGGWTTRNGLTNYDKHVRTYIEKHGCDLFVLAFGMNDLNGEPDDVYGLQKAILDKVLEQSPEASLIIMSTMVPNPEATNGWYGRQPEQEERLLKGAEEDYQAKGIPCSVCQMTSTSKAIYERKAFRDSTGNNINHPNDFMVRVYAQTLLADFIGYYNLDK